MANFKGKIRTIGDKVYKKSRTLDKPTTIVPIPMECDVYIPNINQLDLSEFSMFVDPSDENRVFYAKTVSSSDKISIRDAGTNITFYNGSNMEGKIFDEARVGTAAIDNEKYVYTSPYRGEGTPSDRYEALYCYNYYNTQSGPDSLSFNAMKLAEFLFDANDNVDVKGLEGQYNQAEDSITMPGTNTTINSETTPGIILCDDEYFPAFRGSSRADLIQDTSDNKFWKAYSQVYGSVYMFGKNGKVTANIPVCRIGGTGNAQLNPSVSSGSSAFCIFCLFLDDDGNFWIMTVQPQLFGTSINIAYITLTKVKNIYTSLSSRTSTVAGTLSRVPNYLPESTFGDINKFFHKLVAIDKESGGGDYGEDGPDIIGPGDVYEDILNNSNVQQVGGRPNIVDDVEDDIAQPNTGIDKFRIKSGYFGSYELTDKNLKQYSDTLSACYEHANDLLFGWVAKDVANIIKDNTNNVIMLPFDIPSQNKIAAPFSVGNCLIADKMEGRLDYDRWAGTTLLPSPIDNYATANLITKEMTEFVINLGTIPHYYDNFLDFPPYSEGKMYIPYIGTVSIPLDMMQSTSDEQKNIELVMRCNNTNGDLLALLRVDGKTLNHWTGNCARGIQINVQDNSDIIRDGANRIIGAISPVLGATIPSQHFSSTVKPVIEDVYEYNPKTMENELVGSSKKMMKDTYSYEHTNVPSPSPSTNTLPNIPSVHSISSNSPSGGAVGYMDSQDVILTIYRPVVWKPYDYGGLIGFPTKRIAKLSSVKGFARVSEMHLKCSATSSEKNEIISLLSGGVLFDEN